MQMYKPTSKNEPEIYKAVRFGTILENCVIKQDRTIDFNDNSLQQKTRSCVSD